jgi:hypothetical protein
VKGQVTVIGDNFATSNAVEDQVLPAIQYVMQSSLVTVNVSNVLSVQYLDYNRSSVAPITTPPLPESKAPISTSIPTSVPTQTPIIPTYPISYVPFTFAPVNALPSMTPGTTKAPFTATPSKPPTATPIISLTPISMAPQTTTPQLTSSPFVTPVSFPSMIPISTNTLTPIVTSPVRDGNNNQSPFICWQCSLFGVACFAAFLVVVVILVLIFARHRRRNEEPDQSLAENIVRKDTTQLSKVQTDEEDPYEPPPSSMSVSTPLQPYKPDTLSISSQNIDLIKSDSNAIPIVSTTIMDNNQDDETDNDNETQDNSNATLSQMNRADASGGQSTLYYEDEDNIEEFFEDNHEEDEEEEDETEGTYGEETVEEVTYRDGDDEYIAPGEEEEGEDEEDVDEVFDEVSYMEGESQYEVNEEQVKWATQKLPFGDHSFT